MSLFGEFGYLLPRRDRPQRPEPKPVKEQRADAAKKQRARAADYKRRGECRLCYDPVAPGQVSYCERHRAERYAYNKALRDAKKEKGLCMNCPKRLAPDSATFCEGCRDKKNERDRLRRAKNK